MTAKNHRFVYAALAILLALTPVAQATSLPAQQEPEPVYLTDEDAAPASPDYVLAAEKEDTGSLLAPAAPVALPGGYNNLGAIPLDGCENWECEWWECPDLCDGL